MAAKVTAVWDTKHVELVKGLGADRVIDYGAEDFTKDTRPMTWSWMRWARARSVAAGGC